MPRNISSDNLTALAASNIQPVYFAALQFTSGVSYFWTGIGVIHWNGHDWSGTGALGTVSDITQTDELSAENITLALSGILSTNVSAALNECRQNNTVDVWLGLLADNGSLIVDPVKTFSGRMDVPTVQDDGETATISITAENELIILQRASQRRYTNDDQHIDFPDDNGFQFAPHIMSWNGIWGSHGGGLGHLWLGLMIFPGNHVSKHNID